MRPYQQQTYKDQYHFSDRWFRVNGDDYPSIKDEDKINSTIKENPDRSNVEIEGKEVILEPDLLGLYNAMGKSHNRGGMNVMLKPNSFVFSNDKTLALKDSDYELFELKKGGNMKPSNNTPAAALKRNVDIKHYNTLLNNLDDPYKDDLAKKSSAMMLEKYIQTLGGVAYIQEEKKGFPDGLPPWTMGSAPVYSTELKDNKDEIDQFAKYGGTIYAEGGNTNISKCPCGKNDDGSCKPCTEAQVQEILAKAQKATLADVTGMNVVGKYANKTAYHSGTDPLAGKAPGKGSAQFNKAFGDARRAGKKTFMFNGKLFNTQLATPGTAGKPGTDKFLYVEDEQQAKPCPCGTNFAMPDGCNPCPEGTKPKELVQDPTVTPVTGTDQWGKSADWTFTPWQRIRQAVGFGNVANIHRYMPTRFHFNPTYVDPALLNEQQAVSNARGVYGQQLRSLNTLSPIMRNAQANSAYGQLLDQIPNIGLNVQNANVGIRNQFALSNQDVRNRADLVNMGEDKTYARDSVLARAHFDNMRTHASNEAWNQVFQDAMDNQSLAYKELTLNNPAYKFDFRTGNLLRNMDKNILDVQGRDPEDSWKSMIEQVSNLKRMGMSDQVISALVRGQFFKQAAPFFRGSTNPPPFPYKKGGTFKNPY